MPLLMLAVMYDFGGKSALTHAWAGLSQRDTASKCKTSSFARTARAAGVSNLFVLVLLFHSSHKARLQHHRSHLLHQPRHAYAPPVSHCPASSPPIHVTLSAGTVDVGVPQLSMHSIREMCGVDDVLNCKLLAQHLLADFRELDSNFGQ